MNATQWWIRGLRFALVMSLLSAFACSSGNDAGATKSEPDASATDDTANSATDDAADDAGADDDATDDDATDEDAAPQPLALTSIDPTAGQASGNQPLIVYGTGFEAGCEVLIDGTPIDPDQVFFVDSTELQVQTPPHAPGLASVTVINPPPAPGQPSPSETLPDA